MTAAERRASSSRRGMTVLGKVPVAPKPINLPSQRLENRGLFPDVDIVQRWGSAGQFPGARDNKPRKPDSALLKPFCNGGEKENCGKAEGAPILSTSNSKFGVKDGGGGLPETSLQFSSSANAINVQALQSNEKRAEPRNSNSNTQNSIHGWKQGTTENSLQNSVDGCSAQHVPPPPGFHLCGLHGTHARAGAPTSDLQSNGGGHGMHPNTSQHYSDIQSNGGGHGMHPNTSQQMTTQSFPGMPLHNAPKEREIIVIHMVGSPAFYGNYPPQLGYPAMYGRNGHFPLQFGNFEPYNGFQALGCVDNGAQISSVSGSELFNEHEDYVCYEKECYHGRSRNGLTHGNLQESTFLSAKPQRDLHESLVRSRSTRSGGRQKSLYHNGKLVPVVEAAAAAPVPERRITLLTKMSQHGQLTTKSLGETVISEGAHAEYVIGSALSAPGDEGKAPETVEADTVLEDAQAENAHTSSCLNMTDEVVATHKETEPGSNGVSVATVATHDEKCLDCKAEASTLQGCMRPTTEEVLEELSDKSSNSSTYGCVVEVKHVIFDADRNAGKAQEEDAAVSSPKKSGSVDKLLDKESTTAQPKQSLKQNHKQAVKGKYHLCAKNGIMDRKWKPKNPVVAAKSAQRTYVDKKKEQSTLPARNVCQHTPKEVSLPPKQEAALVESVSQQTSPEEGSLSPKQEAKLRIGENKEKEDAQKQQDILVSMEMECISVQKHLEEEVLPPVALPSPFEGQVEEVRVLNQTCSRLDQVEEVLPPLALSSPCKDPFKDQVEEVPPPSTLPSPSKDQVEEVPVLTQTCGQENRSGDNLRPPFKKKNAMSYEKANRYHQIMFKKYKETGTWKARAEVQSSKAVKKKKDCASERKGREASIKVVIVA